MMRLKTTEPQWSCYMMTGVSIVPTRINFIVKKSKRSLKKCFFQNKRVQHNSTSVNSFLRAVLSQMYEGSFNYLIV